MKWLQFLALAAFMTGCGLIQMHSPAAEDLALRRGFNWRIESTSHFTIYYEADAPAQKLLDPIKKDAEASLTHVLYLLNEHSYNEQLHLFVVSSRARMRKLVGRETNGAAFYDTGVLAFIVSENRRLGARHELLHVVAMNLWGVPEVWINEGLAVYADDHWHGHDLHALAHHLDGKDRLLSLDDLIERFRRHDDLITYPEAGSIVKYLYEEYGFEAVKVLWDQGGGAVEEATGRTLSELEAEWLTVVRATDASGIDYEIE